MFKLTSDDKNLNLFFDDLRQELKRTKTSLVLSTSDVYIDDSRVSGYYSKQAKTIMVKFDEFYLETLLHEYCHYLQYQSKKPITKDIDYHLNIMWKWLNKEIEIDIKLVKKSILAVQNLELDCERMVLKLVKKYKLKIDLERYISIANVYIYFHNYVLRNRTWLKDDMGIESFEELLLLVPKDLKGKRNTMDEAWYYLMDKYF